MKKGVVSAGHPQTAWAAATILEEGGNAFDAAVAATFATCVNEFCMSSLGGGFFANVYTKDKKSLLYDAFCQTPIKKRPVAEADFYPITLDFGGTTEEFHIGMGSISTPGTLAGIFAIHKDFCTLPIEKLIGPAVSIAKNGSLVDDFQAFDYAILEPMLRVHPDSRALFIQDDQAIKEGNKVKFPFFADFLKILAKEGADLFYKGEVAQQISRDSRENGGYLSMQDFEQYEVIRRSPLRFSYRDHTILTNPLPSIGGSMVALAMHYLEEMARSDYRLDSKHVNRLYKVFKKMQPTNHRTPEGLGHMLLDKGIIDEFQSSVGYTQKRGNTTHFTIMDKEGNTISITSSNGEGSGYMAKGTHIMLNNMLGEAALLPKGFHSWTPDVRLSSMMSPTIALDQFGQTELALGTGGASRIPFAILQVLHYYLDHQLSLDRAVHAPRVHLQDGNFNIEPGLPTLDLQNTGDKSVLWKEKSMYFGGINAVTAKPASFPVAVADYRRSGVVIHV